MALLGELFLGVMGYRSAGVLGNTCASIDLDGVFGHKEAVGEFPIASLTFVLYNLNLTK